MQAALTEEPREIYMPPEKKVWSPLPGSQTLFMSCPANVILYHGTRGPGKTDGQLMRFRRNVGLGYGSFWRGIIFDREYKNLDDIIIKSMRWFPAFNDGARFLRSASDYKWVWPTGEELLFRAIKKDSDYWNYHGQEFPFIGWNELTKYPTPSLYDDMMSCNRSSFLPQENPIIEKGKEPVYLPEIPLEVAATSNPYGVGHNWVKKKFINAGPPCKMINKVTNVFNPQTQKDEDITRTQTHIFGSYRENRFLSPEYIAELHATADPNKRKAWLTGSWDIVSGGMFDDVWNSDVHVVTPFDIPKSWRIDRSFDWGSSAPFSVGWWAESDGSDLKLRNGKTISTVRGDLYRILEWYGSSGKTNDGLKMLDEDIAAGIIELEINHKLYGKVKPGPADNSINDVTSGNSTAKTMRKSVRVKGSVYRGVTWTKSDKSPGSRHNGWNAIRSKLNNSLPTKHGGPREKPGIFIFNTCTDCIDLFPILPRDEKDPDDVDTDAEDHIGDEIRYRVLDSNRSRAKNSTKGL